MNQSVTYDLQGKVAAVTGGARGIGRKIVLSLARSGADVAILDVLEEEMAETVLEAAKTGSKSEGYRCDVADWEEVSAVFEEIHSQFEKVDILVNDAAISIVKPIEELTIEEWNRVLSINLSGTFHCCKAVVPDMKARAEGGKIINFTSAPARLGTPHSTAYVASKLGIEGFSRSLAQELAAHQINVNVVAPGVVQTALLDNIWEQRKHHLKKSPDQLNREAAEQIPMKRLAQPEDIANLVLFLASSASDYITGEIIQCSGGMTNIRLTPSEETE